MAENKEGQNWAGMLKELHTLEKAPALFSSGDIHPWDDEWISAHTLKSHFDEDSDDSSRPRKEREASLAWLEQNFPLRGCQVLDLGCGPGIFCRELAQRGARVTGVDVSRISLHYAKQRNDDEGLDIRYFQGELEKPSAEWLGTGQYDLVILFYGTLGTLSPKARDRLLEALPGSLKPGGVLVFDTFRKSYLKHRPHKRSWALLGRGKGYWSDQAHLYLYRSHSYPQERVWLQQFVLVEARGCRVARLWYRYYSPRELRGILESRWTVELYDDLTGRPLSREGEWIAAVCRPRDKGSKAGLAEARGR